MATKRNKSTRSTKKEKESRRKKRPQKLFESFRGYQTRQSLGKAKTKLCRALQIVMQLVSEFIPGKVKLFKEEHPSKGTIPEMIKKKTNLSDGRNKPPKEIRNQSRVLLYIAEALHENYCR